MSLNGAKNLHQQDFDYETDDQRMGVIRQYLFFFIHCADRLMFDHFDQQNRSEFINALSTDCKNHFATNVLEISGQRIDSTEFITALNQFMEKLSMCRFVAR